jgi:small conductance mechanosensitive channel
MNKVFAVSPQTAESANQASELAKILAYILEKLPFFFAGIIIVILTFFVAKIAKSIVENKLADKGLDEDHKEVQVLAGRLVYSGVVIIGLTAGLNLAGIDITSIIAAGAFGVGFALKDIIVNFIAGILILIGRDITIGDFIKVKGQVGRIEAIQSRVTILRAVNGTKVVVPNSVLFKNKITSFSGNPLRRFDIIVPIDYRHNLDNIIKIMLYSASITPDILQQPKPKVGFVDLGDKGFKLKLKAWCESRSGWLKVRTKLAHNLVEQFAKHNIKFPFTTYTINQYKDTEINELPFNEAANSQETMLTQQNSVNQFNDGNLSPQANQNTEQNLAPQQGLAQASQNAEQNLAHQQGLAQTNQNAEQNLAPQQGLAQASQNAEQNLAPQQSLAQENNMQVGDSAISAPQQYLNQAQSFTEEEINSPMAVPLNVALNPQTVPVDDFQNLQQ